MRPLLQMTPWRMEVESLQGLAKFSSFQLWGKLVESSKDLLRCVRHASSLGSDKIPGIKVTHHSNSTHPTSITRQPGPLLLLLLPCRRRAMETEIKIHPNKSN
ncbi:hypothetical protein V8G54_015332 [Vigna mungo]|uniref:Uncharacterized protein n=1 Tax=Vigna mungo TaxID=3915 RepID=A0AAQ3RYB6_VIGMU